MTTRERSFDRGRRLGRAALVALGSEIRAARIDRGLTTRAVAQAAHCDPSTVSRVERGLVPGVTYVFLAVLASIVGLDLVGRLYPGGQPLREPEHAGLLGYFGSLLHRSLYWGTEVPLPGAREQRAWDGMVRGPSWRYGTELEMAPTDSQALNRRLQLKVRDGNVDGVMLLLPKTRRAREFMAGAGATLAPNFPVPGATAMERLQAGENPGGSSIIVLERPKRAA
jgi:transcriptional regulator with XRE-family HTH domain